MLNHSSTRPRVPGLVVLALIATLFVQSVPRTAASQQPPADMIPAAVAQLDGIVTEMMGRTGVPGVSVAVVYRDQVVYLKGFGVRSTGATEAVDPDTVFQLASVSKPVASTVVAALVGDGIVDWDDPIVKRDPDFAMFDPWVTQEVTLRDMFAHRSGLPDHAADLLEDIGYSRAEVLHRLRYQRPDSSFRSAYAYTNFGLTEGGVAAARPTGQSWEEISNTRLYQPLGMTSTSSSYADFVARPNRARGHVLMDGQWVAKFSRDPDAQSPAGGVSSSARDMAQWMRLHLDEGKIDGRQIVAEEPLIETHSPQMVSRPPASTTDRAGFYGLGWNVSYDDEGRVRLGHSGGFALGAGTAVSLVPSEQLGIIVLTNAAPIGVPEAITTSFLDLALVGSIQQDWLSIIGPFVEAAAGPAYGKGMDYSRPPQAVAPARSMSAYVGTYENDFIGPIEVTAAGDSGVLHLGPNQEAFTLTHWDGDVFLYQPTGENAGGPSRVTFAFGPEDTATSVQVENLDVTGEGTMLRRP